LDPEPSANFGFSAHQDVILPPDSIFLRITLFESTGFPSVLDKMSKGIRKIIAMMRSNSVHDINL